MRYLPHTEEEISEMLTAVGKETLDDLFCTIPPDCRRDDEIALPQAMTEWQLDAHMTEIGNMLEVTPQHKVLVGAGSYHHYIPEMIRALASRSEFLTAYTPYQPEMAQGTLQGIYEYQTLTARLLGMDVANASIYDGAASLAEALLMGLRIKKKKKKVAVSKGIHPHHRQVVRTYLQATEFEIVELPIGDDGRTDLSLLEGVDDLAAVAIQSPNFLGVIEDLSGAGEKIHAIDAIYIASFTEALAFGLIKNPGECGADIVCGEGQSMGLNRSFGGPGLGMFACREKLTRNMPGRLVGETVDRDGKRGFVLTLATREQHIRREKATSNICSNQGVCAMMAGMFMATLGGTGLRELARLNHSKAEYLKAELKKAGAEIVFDSPTFNEFLVRFSFDFEPVYEKLFERGFVAGINVGKYYPQYKGCYLFCATETVTREDIDAVIQEVSR
ncbi:aminomethyl-transferring glycine dehydrogenase subunit GcvPA [Desulfosediminicola ganghwensis]|uniref:aminomethyl-transferring glycine dehydrogenase subunit GcvPA n=1 Tax=Desulfosediminicola ganghwensis TaxID=2569540 RepID=UPI0010ACC4D9|nr:aminomethyl-transferring glycine dehydrogenase subunit GcvPA [Desulfosediminicola ganghwensis]